MNKHINKPFPCADNWWRVRKVMSSKGDGTWDKYWNNEFLIVLTPVCKESQFYSLPFGQAEANTC